MGKNDTSLEWTLGSLVNAGGKMVTVCNNDTLKKAITIMKLNDYSQLPVVRNESKGKVYVNNIEGYISWKTICEAREKGVKSTQVKDYKTLDTPILRASMSLMEAFESIGKDDFVLVKKDRGTCGIVTLYDIASHHMNLTKPFVLIEQIEKILRSMLSDHVSKELLDSVKQEKGRKVNSLGGYRDRYTDRIERGYMREPRDNPSWDRGLPICYPLKAISPNSNETTVCLKRHEILNIKA